jgi:hypothetical protein
MIHCGFIIEKAGSGNRSFWGIVAAFVSNAEFHLHVDLRVAGRGAHL